MEATHCCEPCTFCIFHIMTELHVCPTCVMYVCVCMCCDSAVIMLKIKSYGHHQAIRVLRYYSQCVEKFRNFIQKMSCLLDFIKNRKRKIDNVNCFIAQQIKVFSQLNVYIIKGTDRSTHSCVHWLCGTCLQDLLLLFFLYQFDVTPFLI